MTVNVSERRDGSVIAVMRSVGSATLLPVVLGVLSAPMLARAMEPGDRGRLAGVLAAATVVSVIALGGVAQQLPKDLASLPRSGVWPRVIGAARTLLPGAVVLAVGLAVVGAFAWSGSMVQAPLIVIVVMVSWLVGIARGALVGVGDHRMATATFVFEAIARFLGVAALLISGTNVGPSVALIATGIVPPVVAGVAVSPRLRELRRLSLRDPHPSAVGHEKYTGRSAVPISLAQQFMGRSILSVWALGLSDDEMGFLVIAFALTELTLSFARLGQPFVIQRAEAGHPAIWPWIAVTSAASAISAVGGLIVLEPLFGSDYSGAERLLVPLAIAEGCFAVVVFATGIRFVTDRSGAIDAMVRGQGATVIVTVAVAFVGDALAVATTFAVMSALQAAAALRSTHLGHLTSSRDDGTGRTSNAA